MQGCALARPQRYRATQIPGSRSGIRKNSEATDQPLRRNFHKFSYRQWAVVVRNRHAVLAQARVKFPELFPIIVLPGCKVGISRRQAACVFMLRNVHSPAEIATLKATPGPWTCDWPRFADRLREADSIRAREQRPAVATWAMPGHPGAHKPERRAAAVARPRLGPTIPVVQHAVGPVCRCGEGGAALRNSFTALPFRGISKSARCGAGQPAANPSRFPNCECVIFFRAKYTAARTGANCSGVVGCDHLAPAVKLWFKESSLRFAHRVPCCGVLLAPNRRSTPHETPKITQGFATHSENMTNNPGFGVEAGARVH